MHFKCYFSPMLAIPKSTFPSPPDVSFKFQSPSERDSTMFLRNCGRVSVRSRHREARRLRFKF